MGNELAKVSIGGELVRRANDYIADSLSENTRRAYAWGWGLFCDWCKANGVPPLPAAPATVAAFFSAMADQGKKPATISQLRAAVRMAHETAGHADPTSHKQVKLTMKGIRRTLGTAPVKKAAILTEDIRAMVRSLPDSLLGARDRALLLVGFAGAFRRSEVAALTVDCIEHTAEGVKVFLPKSKTDQEGRGRYVGIKRTANAETCPVRALAAWIAAADIESGPVFRNVDRHGRIGETAVTPQVVALVVKRSAIAAGLDPAKYSGHSLRAGFVTQTAMNGAAVSNIMRQTGHTSPATVQGYIRMANLFVNNPSGMLGL